MNDNDPITLKVAAADFGIPVGVLKANGVAGKLEIYKLGTKYYTTPNAVRNWVQSCRVEPRDHGSILTRRARSGLSETDRALSALAAARETAAALKNSSRITLAASTSRNRQARQRLPSTVIVVGLIEIFAMSVSPSIEP